jgi:hypothetical protein
MAKRIRGLTLSSRSLTAPYCRAEMREAMRLGKRFLPVMIKANTRIDRAQDLARHIRQWLDLSSGLNTEALADLYREINITLENPPFFSRSRGLNLLLSLM